MLDMFMFADLRVQAYIHACIIGRWKPIGKGWADNRLHSLNSEIFIVTYAEGSKYIDHRTFNLMVARNAFIANRFSRGRFSQIVFYNLQIDIVPCEIHIYSWINGLCMYAE